MVRRFFIFSVMLFVFCFSTVPVSAECLAECASKQPTNKTEITLVTNTSAIDHANDCSCSTTQCDTNCCCNGHFSFFFSKHVEAFPKVARLFQDLSFEDNLIASDFISKLKRPPKHSSLFS